jgi:hypothetical protein
LVDSGSTDTFLGYSFASQSQLSMISTPSRVVKVAGGGTLNSTATTCLVHYSIQKESFASEFKLLQLKSYDIILCCDWIKQHNPIGLDLREGSRQLIIQKDGYKQVIFQDFTSLPEHPVISTHKLEKLCRAETVGYII